ncbi:MAG: ABC transporter permease subunit [Candidatus Calescibacterium sp.]|nr:ABC transporter permease [Candidatus Calescibacterium sp.]MCX7971626.1 ABC transporter permease [bacterium]MDW8195834.1 ABC transporter permease subunit [Candidatus Calescibacterium sp.]
MGSKKIIKTEIMLNKLGKTIAIAKYTIDFEFRRFLPHTIVFLGLVFVGISSSFNFFGMRFQERVFYDISLTLIGIFLLILAISLGISNIAHEIERRIVYTFLSKPISRDEYFVGKFLGTSFFLFFAYLLFSIECFLIVYFYTKKLVLIIFAALGLQLIKSMIILAFCMLLSIFVSSPVNITLTLLFYTFCELSVLYVSTISEGILQKILLYTKLFLPYFDYLNITQGVVFAAGTPINPWYVFFAFIYGICYIIFFLSLCNLIFSKKEL